MLAIPTHRKQIDHGWTVPRSARRSCLTISAHAAIAMLGCSKKIVNSALASDGPPQYRPVPAGDGGRCGGAADPGIAAHGQASQPR
jgi:hypothetical protein